MQNFTAVIERDPDTALFVGFVPGFPGAHSQGATMEELRKNLHEVIAMLLESGAEVVGVIMKFGWLRLALVFCLGWAGISCATSSHAGGSIGWDQVKAEIVRDDPFMADFIAKRFDMERIGWGTRIGSHMEGRLPLGYGVGDRIPPYHFQAKPKSQKGGHTLLVTLEPVYGNTKKMDWQISIRKNPDEN